MIERQRNCKKLVLLVDSNPLPNFLAVILLKPESVCLVYSRETEEVKNNLQRMLKNKLPKLQISEECVDATNAENVRRVIRSCSKGAHLHYTGGTKIMAAHARMAFESIGGQDKEASYLDEPKGLLRFDDGAYIDLLSEHVELAMDDILELHGIRRISKAGGMSISEPSNEDARKIAMEVLRTPDLAARLYGLHRKEGKLRSFNDAKQNPIALNGLVDGLSIQQLPEGNWNRKTHEQWCDFLGGKWLEAWCALLIGDLISGDKVSVGLECKMDSGRQFEIDVALVRGHRLYAISCTTSTKINLSKSKLFEVAMRARQLGGDLARSALVCLLHGSDSKGPFLHQLQNDVADVWKAPNTPRVFGLDDLREWAGTHGPENTKSLEAWLNS